MLEKDFQAWVLQTAALGGWRAWHVPLPMRPVGQNKFIPDPRGRGLPDLLLMHDTPPRLVFAELKVESRVSAEQEEFLRYARAVAEKADALLPVRRRGVLDLVQYRPVEAFVWRPENRELIEQVLLNRFEAA